MFEMLAPPVVLAFAFGEGLSVLIVEIATLLFSGARVRARRAGVAARSGADGGGAVRGGGSVVDAVSVAARAVAAARRGLARGRGRQRWWRRRCCSVLR
jgi:hypothetical protein